MPSRKTGALARVAAAVEQERAARADIETFVALALHWDATWTGIATALGVTPQAAHKRYRHLRYDPDTGRAWHEAPLPL